VDKKRCCATTLVHARRDEGTLVVETANLVVCTLISHSLFRPLESKGGWLPATGAPADEQFGSKQRYLLTRGPSADLYSNLQNN
jgi:hypothetical protein